MGETLSEESRDNIRHAHRQRMTKKRIDLGKSVQRYKHEFERRRVIQDEQQFYDALAVVDFLLHANNRDQGAALEAAQAENGRRSDMIGSDGGFWREVIRILEQPEMTWDEIASSHH